MEEGRQLMLIAGLHDVRLALGRQPCEVTEVLIGAYREDKRMTEIMTLASRCGVPVKRLSRRELDELSAGVRHQGVLARCRADRQGGYKSLESLLTNLDHDPLLLVLDGVQDPHNLGACLRSADGAGVDAVIVPEDRSCKITPVVSRVAAGAANVMPFFAVVNLGRTLMMLKERGIWIAGAVDHAETALWDTDLTGPLALVLGAEGTGLRDLTRRHCDYLVGIPMQGTVESLNVSVASAVMLYEARRQRRGSDQDRLPPQLLPAPAVQPKQ
jgi:predicted rRNA methylase